MTRFQITCDNWSDEDLQLHRSPSDDIYFSRPLEYSFYYKGDQGWNLLHSSTDAKSPSMYLPVNPDLPLKVEIRDFIGAAETVYLTAHVQPYTAGARDLMHMIKNPQGEMEKLLQTRNYRGALRLQAAISNHLKGKSSCLSISKLSLEEHQEIRSELLSSFSKVNSFLTTKDDLNQGINTLSNIVTVHPKFFIEKAKV